MNVICEDGIKIVGWFVVGYLCGIVVIVLFGCIRIICFCVFGYMYWGCCGMYMIC